MPMPVDRPLESVETAACLSPPARLFPQTRGFLRLPRRWAHLTLRNPRGPCGRRRAESRWWYTQTNEPGQEHMVCPTSAAHIGACLS